MKEVPIWEKSNLTIEEAAAYFGIGIHKLRKMTDKDDCCFVLWIGSYVKAYHYCMEHFNFKKVAN